MAYKQFQNSQECSKYCKVVAFYTSLSDASLNEAFSFNSIKSQK